MTFYIDILYYGIVRRTLDKGSYLRMLAHGYFSFLIFFNCVTLFFLINQFLKNNGNQLWSYDNVWVPFFVGQLIGIALAIIYRLRLSNIMGKKSITNLKDLDLIAIGYSLFSFAAF